MSFESRVQSLGIELPDGREPGGHYVPAKIVGSLCYLAGMVSIHDDTVITGTVGHDRTVDQAYVAARACGLAQLAALKSALGSLDRVVSIVSVTGFISSVRGFQDHSSVMNGFSDLMEDIFGEAGKHVRAAVGVSSLPRNAVVEVQMVAEVKPR